MKTRVDDLALFGGPPEFEEFLHVGRPNIGDRARLLERFNDALDRAWLTNNGPYVEEFESAVCRRTGAKHCISTSSGTIALEIAIRAAGMSGEVIVPSFTFIATAHALQWQGITPVFCDIDPMTQTIDPAAAEELISDRTTGIIGVHLWGRPCDVGALQEIADASGLKLLFDAAHAWGCSYEGTMIGNFGAAEIFSFHATKVVNTFEGGAIVTNDDDLAHKAGLISRFGFSDYDEVTYLGTNAKMMEVAAAMGLCSLEAQDSIFAINRRNYLLYRSNLSDIPGVTMLEYEEANRCNYHYIVLEIDENAFGVGRDVLYQILMAERVLARRYFYPGAHGMEPYRSDFPEAWRRLPHTRQHAERVLVLPTGSAIDADEIERISQIVCFVGSNANGVRHRFDQL